MPETTLKQIDKQRHEETTLRYTPEQIEEHCKGMDEIERRFPAGKTARIIRQLQG